MFFILKPDEPLIKSLDHQPGTMDLHTLVNDKPGLKETADRLVRIIALLPEGYRQVFFLKVVQGMSIYQISITLRCSMLQVYLDIHKIRRHIQKNIEIYRFTVQY